ncbi:outer membrane beta-barrel protein [Mucilaginibacter sp.]
MKFTVFAAILCIWGLHSSAQSSYSLKGAVTDSAANTKLSSATITVVAAKDSILKAFAWVGEDGRFAINNLPKGKFLLMISYPGYADYVDKFSLDSAHTSQDFGKIDMILKARLLADVIVKAKATAVKIKGDTTEFNAKAFVVQPNATVEDLLKELPGIQVDKDGKITAQGETVTKVLVDGEEFFGDDPTLVTKNLRADMVDKVQLYDKKSDQATFTGIDDGKTTKTINIKLKADKKNGEFGKVDANAGTDGYYEGQLQFNKFKEKQKLALYGTLANDGKTGLGFQDSNSLGFNNIQYVDGGISISNSGNDALDSFSGYYDGKGIPVARAGGVHYDDKFDKDNQSINTNYKIGSIDVSGITTTTSQQTLPTGIVNTKSGENFNDYAFRQKLDGTYTIKLDTTADLKISADGTFKHFNVNNKYNTTTFDSLYRPINTDERDVINHGDQQIFDASAFYTKKFKKKGRTLSWSLSESYNKNTTKGTLNSTFDVFDPTTGTETGPPTIINQYKTTDVLSSVINSNITYSEPLTKKTSLLFNYGVALNNSSANRITYNETSPGVYNQFVDSLSNNYKFNQLTNQVGAIYNYQYKKATFNFGTKVSDVAFKQVDEYTGNTIKRDFLNWEPQAMFQYKFSQYQFFRLNYYGNNNEPTIDQIQPVAVNNDPLNITIGNALLKPSFTNNINLYYNSYQFVSGQNFGIRANFNNTYDAIVNNTSYNESTGVNTTSYRNLQTETPYNYNVYISYGKKINPLDIQIGLNASTSGSVTYSYIDAEPDMGRSHTYSGGLYLYKYVQKKYDFYFSGGPSYTFSTMSLQPLTNNNAAGFNGSGDFNLYLPLHFGAGSSVNYTYNAATQAFSAEHLTTLNAYIFKTFLKDDKLKISLSGNDLLNQNLNFTRGIAGNTSTQTNTTGIRRLFMLSVTWDFTKFGTIKSSN